MIKVYDLSYFSNIIDKIVFEDNFSYGADGNNIPPPTEVFIVIEELYNILGSRHEISSIKYFKEINDELAFDWHTDDTNPAEPTINHIFLLYLPGCEGSYLEIKDSTDITAAPYQLIYLDNSVIHRGKPPYHGRLMKFTFI
jgi:hypothetical protein